MKKLIFGVLFTLAFVSSFAQTVLVTGKSTLEINYGFTVTARKHPAYYVWKDNYGYTIQASDLSYKIKDITSTGNSVVITVAGMFLPGSQVTLSFAPKSTSPVRSSDGSALSSHSGSATYNANFTGTVYYVSSVSGNDANPGTLAKPFASIAKVNSLALTPGTTVLFKGNETFLGKMVTKSGVLYSKYGSGLPTINGNGEYDAISMWDCNNVTLHGLRVINKNTGFGTQGIRLQNAFDAKLLNLLVEQCSNGIYVRHTGARITVEGCESRNHYNSCLYYEGYDQGPAIYDTYTYYNNMHSVVQNDVVSYHERYEKIGFLGTNHEFVGNYLWDGPSEELLDVTSGSKISIRDNFLENADGAFMALGWSAKQVSIVDNFMQTLPGQRVPTAYIKNRVNDVLIQNNIFKGTCYNPYKENARSFIFIYGSTNDNSQPNNIKVYRNTFDLEANQNDAPGYAGMVMEIFTMTGLPVPQAVTFKNNVTLSRGKYGVVEMNEHSLYPIGNAKYVADSNYYYPQINSNLYEDDATQLSLAQVQSKGKELKSKAFVGQQWDIEAKLPGPYYYNPKTTAVFNNLAGAFFDPASAAPPVVEEPTPEPPACVVPQDWVSEDIGAVGLAGSGCYDNGVYSVSGAGADIWSTTDAFHFMYTTLTGDGEISARVTSTDPTHDWSKAGVMMRASLSANSRNALTYVSSALLWSFQRRALDNGSTISTRPNTFNVLSLPYWVKLVRNGNQVSGYRSTDGATWTFIATETIDLPATIYVGLAVNSYDVNQLNLSTFDNVKITAFGPGTFPVELTGFDAKPQPENRRVQLQWSTASESNNNYFTVERSTDGSFFTPVLQTPSKGNSNQTQTYEAFDTEPVEGKSFYRLKQTDLDGTFTYSDRVELVYEPGIKPAIKIFPSPAEAGTDVQVEYLIPGARSVTLNILNSNGQKMQMQTLPGASSGRAAVNTTGLTPGLYFIQASSADTPGVFASSRLIVIP
ncbi:MAG: hypothetical protein EAZ89_12130 [Bacteroidetes bacterium]|nr:MAG: hypothetical protein EAZ89_12130 [Bacteroidota bacterium]